MYVYHLSLSSPLPSLPLPSHHSCVCVVTGSMKKTGVGRQLRGKHCLLQTAACALPQTNGSCCTSSLFTCYSLCTPSAFILYSESGTCCLFLCAACLHALPACIYTCSRDETGKWCAGTCVWLVVVEERRKEKKEEKKEGRQGDRRRRKEEGGRRRQAGRKAGGGCCLLTTYPTTMWHAFLPAAGSPGMHGWHLGNMACPSCLLPPSILPSLACLVPLSSSSLLLCRLLPFSLPPALLTSLLYLACRLLCMAVCDILWRLPLRLCISFLYMCGMPPLLSLSVALYRSLL